MTQISCSLHSQSKIIRVESTTYLNSHLSCWSCFHFFLFHNIFQTCCFHARCLLLLFKRIGNRLRLLFFFFYVKSGYYFLYVSWFTSTRTSSCSSPTCTGCPLIWILFTSCTLTAFHFFFYFFDFYSFCF